jgi:hypothetical protein
MKNVYPVSSIASPCGDPSKVSSIYEVLNNISHKKTNSSSSLTLIIFPFEEVK